MTFIKGSTISSIFNVIKKKKKKFIRISLKLREKQLECISILENIQNFRLIIDNIKNNSHNSVKNQDDFKINENSYLYGEKPFKNFLEKIDQVNNYK